MRRSRVPGLLMLVGLLGACAAPPAQTSTAGPLVADGAVVTLSAWTPCGDGARCSKVTVPLDWADPVGAQVQVGISLRPADDPAHSAGTVLFNPGGPGADGAGDVAGAGADGFPGGLGERFDLVGIDQRGVGSSSPLIRCAVEPDDPLLSLTPVDQSGFDALVAHNRAVAAGCRAATGPLLDHVDSRSAAHDVEAVRVVLGLSTVRWLGLSYGTVLGVAYAELHPDRVASMVLDGPVDHAAGAGGLTDAENVATTTALTRFLDWCDDPAQDCPLDDASTAYGEVLAAADGGVLAGGQGGVTGEQVRRATFEYLQDPSLWPALGAAVAAALDGDARALAPDPEQRPEPDPAQPVAVPDEAPASAAAAYRAVVCADLAPPFTDLAGLRSRLDALTAAAPDVAGQVEGWGIETGCLGWPAPAYPPAASGPVAGAPPVLVVAGSADPTTPLSLAPALAARLPGASVLPTGLDGHTAYFSGDECVEDAVVSHLLDPDSPTPDGCGLTVG